VELILFWYLQSLNKPITISQNKNRLYLVGDDFYFILRVFKLSKCLDWWLLNWSLGRRRAEKELPSSTTPAINKKKKRGWINLTKFKETKRELLVLLPFLWRRRWEEPQGRLVKLIIMLTLRLHRFFHIYTSFSSLFRVQSRNVFNWERASFIEKQFCAKLVAFNYIAM
jgi:hypothetical protein